MKTAVLFYVFYCQGFLILIAENGLMLRAMILEHPAYALHLRAENDVADKITPSMRERRT